MQQDQDRRMKPIQEGENQNQQQHQQPQKCPRCESMNTKFCYYNNYSLSQPRYFCKTCRRYWTQGGTLRNVPVGGGCRKGKRPRISSSPAAATTTSSSSSSENSRSHSLLQQQQQGLVTTAQNMITGTSSGSVGLMAKESGTFVSGGPMASINYSGTSSGRGGGGFLMNSLATLQSLNSQPQQSFNLNHHQLANLGGDHFGGGTSNLSLLQGFNAVVSSFGSQNQTQQNQTQFYLVGSRDNKSSIGEDHAFHASTASHHHHQQQQNWHQPAGFISSNANPTAAVSDTSALWSVSTSTTTGNTNSNNTNGGGSFPLNTADQWRHNLPGYGPPP